MKVEENIEAPHNRVVLIGRFLNIISMNNSRFLSNSFINL